jgi:hypothetical protein
MSAFDPKRTFAVAQKAQFLPCGCVANSALSASLSSGLTLSGIAPAPPPCARHTQQQCLYLGFQNGAIFIIPPTQMILPLPHWVLVVEKLHMSPAYNENQLAEFDGLERRH